MGLIAATLFLLLPLGCGLLHILGQIPLVLNVPDAGLRDLDRNAEMGKFARYCCRPDRPADGYVAHVHPQHEELIDDDVTTVHTHVALLKISVPVLRALELEFQRSCTTGRSSLLLSDIVLLQQGMNATVSSAFLQALHTIVLLVGLRDRHVLILSGHEIRNHDSAGGLCLQPIYGPDDLVVFGFGDGDEIDVPQLFGPPKLDLLRTRSPYELIPGGIAEQRLILNLAQQTRPPRVCQDHEPTNRPL